MDRSTCYRAYYNIEREKNAIRYFLIPTYIYMEMKNSATVILFSLSIIYSHFFFYYTHICRIIKNLIAEYKRPLSKSLPKATRHMYLYTELQKE